MLFRKGQARHLAFRWDAVAPSIVPRQRQRHLTSAVLNCCVSQYANGMDADQNAVMNAIKSCQSEHGVKVETVVEQLPGRSEQQVRQVIDFLSAEGHIYSTIDDDHYRTTDM